jgi:hypothetical protein
VGSGFTALSPNFETGGDAICNGTETNLVRSLAAEALDTNNSESKVIYAGTDGFGPLDITSPSGGHVWVSTDVASGETTWADRTGSINPSNFPISSIAIDTSAFSSGFYAYVSIMGFHVSHLWQTTDGGNSWTDFTGTFPNNLPDAPVNSVLVDPGSVPSNRTIFVGTDIGVFTSSTGTPNWTELDPLPGGGQSGYLPNVSVTDLHIFNSGGLKLLRASTYGRGLWEFNLLPNPSFRMEASTNPISVFARQQATFSGTVTALNGYNSTVQLSCTYAAPLSCTISPGSVPPVGPGDAFTVTASGPAGNYDFAVHGVDANDLAITNDLALTLYVIDFNLTAPSPNSVNVGPSQTSSPISFQVTAAGAFNGVVNLSCAGLSAAATCNFTPPSVSPVAASAASVTLTISTGANTPAGTFPVLISGTTSGGPIKAQNLTLVVSTVSSPDYALAISNSTLTAAVKTPATFNGTVTSSNGYAKIVNLSCGTNAPPACQISPLSLTPNPSGVPFTVLVSSSVTQSYAFNIVAVGTDSTQISHSQPVTFTSGAGSGGDFSIGVSPPQTVKSGSTAQYAITFAPVGATTFTNVVNYTCDASSSVPLGGCSFGPATPIAAGASASTITLTITTTAPIASLQHRRTLPLYAVWIWPNLFLFFTGTRHTKSLGLRALLFFVTLITLLGLMVSCGGGLQGGGGGGNPGTPIGTYTITVNATSGQAAHSAQVTLQVN